MTDPIQYILSRPAIFENGAYVPTSLDPNAVKREYLRAAKPDGQIDWNDVLDLASDPTSALHEAIDWDDASAASKQRRGTIVAIAWALRDKGTGERFFESLHHQTRNPEDAGRIRINVRVLPPPSVLMERSGAMPVSFRVQPAETTTRPATASTPTETQEEGHAEVVDLLPSEDKSLVVFRRWVEAHRHEPAVLRAALRILYDTL